MGIRVRSLNGFERQGVRDGGCCGQRHDDGLGDPIMMLEGLDAGASFQTASNSPGTAPPPQTTNCRPGEFYDGIEQMCISRLSPAPSLSPIRVAPSPVRKPPETGGGGGGGSAFPSAFAPEGGPGSPGQNPNPAPLPLPAPLPSEDAQVDGGIKIAIAAGGAMVLAAMFMRGGR